MCGLVGVAGSIAKKEKDAFKDLLKLDTIRGPHSTGIATIDGSGDWTVVKKRGTPWDLFDSKEFDAALTKTTYCLIGHNRYATKGKINSTNAHPFEFPDVVGCHNGTIREQHRLPDHTRFEVDSENIFHSIQEDGLDETLGKLVGAYALTYWDSRTEELVLLRNSERTLYITFSKDEKTMFWASEPWMLEVALGRQYLAHGEIHPVAQETIYRFSFERKFNPQPIELNTEKFEEFVPPKPKYHGLNGGQGYHGTNNNPFQNLQKKYGQKFAEFILTHIVDNKHGGKHFVGSLLDEDIKVKLYLDHTKSDFRDVQAVMDDAVWRAKMSVSSLNGEHYLIAQGLTLEEVLDDEDEEDEMLPLLFQGYDGKLLTQEDFVRLTANGCAYCSDRIWKNQASKLKWISHNEVFCPDCAKNGQALALVGS